MPGVAEGHEVEPAPGVVPVLEARHLDLDPVTPRDLRHSRILVDEIGRNSVMPSTMLKIMVSIQVITKGYLYICEIVKIIASADIP